MPKIKAIVFDLDDTLYSERSFQNSGFNFIAGKLKQEGFSVTPKKVFQLYKKYPKTLFNELVVRYNLPHSVQGLIYTYRRHKPKINLYPEVEAVLKKLKKEYSLGLLTDYAHQAQVNKVRALGIKNFFDCIVYTDIIQASKPSKKGFELIKKKLNAGDGEIVYIGDNEVKDFIGAKQANFITVKFANRRGFHSNKKMPKAYKAHFEISGLRDIFGVLKRLNQSATIFYA